MKWIIGSLVAAYYLGFASYAVAAIVAGIVEGVRRVRTGGWKALKIDFSSTRSTSSFNNIG